MLASYVNSFGQNVVVLWEEFLASLQHHWKELVNTVNVYSPPCVASVKRGNTSRRREMNLMVSSMLVVPTVLVAPMMVTKFVVYFSVCISSTTQGSTTRIPKSQ